MKSVFVKKLTFPPSAKELLLQQISKSSFNAETAEGVRVIEESDSHIACHFLIERTFAQSTYNLETEEFDKFNFTKIECIPFFVDFEQDTLDIVGNKHQATRVIEYFGKLTKYKVAVEDAQVDILKLLTCCKKCDIPFSISRAKIAEYPFFDNIIGDCSLSLVGYPNAIDIVTKFQRQITNVTISIVADDSYSIIFYKSGALAIYKDVDRIDIQIIRLLKKGM